MVMNYRKQTDSMVTGSDASEEGCGACWSKHVAPVGKKLCKFVTDIPVEVHGEDILLFVVFGGIVGLRQCLNLNGLHPGVHVISETHSPRACCCERPKTIQWGDAAENDEEKVRTLVPLCPKIKWIIIGGGFPCHGFSALKCEKGGHDKDMRFAQVARVALILIKAFKYCIVKRFYECVASMGNEEAAWLTHGINAVALDTANPRARVGHCAVDSDQ